MKKLLLSMALALFCGAIMAQTSYALKETKLTSSELNSVTTPTYIAIKNLSATNHYFFVGNTGATPYSKEQFSNDAVFIWEPVAEGQAGSYRLKKLDGTYMQTSAPKDFGTVDNAAVFTTTNPTSAGSGATKFNGDGDSQSYINGNNDENLVRFVKGSNWINVQNGASGTPVYNTGTGGWTIHYVYEVEEISEEAIVADWKKTNTSIFGCVGSYSEELRETIEGITTIAEINEFEANNTKLAISTNDYYRLVCVHPKPGNGGDSNYNTLAFNGEGNLVTTPANSSNINQIFKFEDAGNGKFYLKNLNADGYLNKIAAGSYRSAIVAQSDACKLDITAHDAVAQWKLHNSESNNAMHCLFAENHPSEDIPYACSGWDAGANSASAWYIVPAKSIEITVNQYASVYLPFAVMVEGATAYAVTATSETSATLTEMADIAANEGAILAGNGTATLDIVNAATTDWTANLLEGTTYTTNVAKDAYVLYNGENGIGFYKADKNQADDTAFKNWANKAYLPMPEGTEGIKSYSFRFEGGTTGVENVEVESASNIIYDLTGRRVEAMERGIYIINGKKVLVK